MHFEVIRCSLWFFKTNVSSKSYCWLLSEATRVSQLKQNWKNFDKLERKSIRSKQNLRVGGVTSVAMFEKWLEWNKRARGKIKTRRKDYFQQKQTFGQCIKRLCSALSELLFRITKYGLNVSRDRTAPASLWWNIVASF